MRRSLPPDYAQRYAFKALNASSISRFAASVGVLNGSGGGRS